MKISNILSVVMLCLVSLNVFASEVVCGTSRARMPSDAVLDLNEQIKNKQNVTVSSPFFFTKNGDAENTGDPKSYTFACVTINPK